MVKCPSLVGGRNHFEQVGYVRRNFRFACCGDDLLLGSGEIISKERLDKLSG